MDWHEIYDRGIINGGNLYRFGKLFTRAENGEHLTVGFLGGSITQGALATTPQKCYAYLVYLWLKEQFPDAKWEYINAGIGATTSQFGVARVESDLLRYEPDLVFLEYSVNDPDNDFFKETFEGTVRRILTAKSRPALFMFNNAQYDGKGDSARVHNEIGRAYGLPIVSMKTSLFAEVAAGRILAPDISPDNLHPNDSGHRLVADVILNLLAKIFCAVSGGQWECKGLQAEEKEQGSILASGAENHAARKTDIPSGHCMVRCERACVRIDNTENGAGYFLLRTGDKILFTQDLPFTQDQDTIRPPVTKNRFAGSVRYQNPDFKTGNPPGVTLNTNGFTPDPRPQEYGVADVFKNGWRADAECSFFEITFEEVSSISVQFCRTVKQPAPIAKAVVDGDEENQVILDANFDETWGDCCYLKDIAMWLPSGRHTLTITIVERPKHMESDFYLISVITA